MSSNDSKITTIGLKMSTKRDLDSLKPYDSVSYDEFVNELLDVYEAERLGQ